MDQLPYGQIGCDKTAKYELKQLQLSQNAVLSDLTMDGVWFTSALTLTGLRLPVDPLSDFLARRPDDGVRIYLTNQRPLFAGIGNERMRHWDYAVFWCPNENWDEIGSHLANCVFRDLDRSMTFSRWLEGTMLDVPWFYKMVSGIAVPRVPVQVLGLKGTDWHHVLHVPNNSPDPLRVVRERININDERQAA